MSSTTTTTAATLLTIPTVSRAIRLPNPYKYWWLRSPVTSCDDSDGFINPSGYVGVYTTGHVYRSYGYIINLRTRDGMELGAVTLMVVSCIGGGTYLSYGYILIHIRVYFLANVTIL